MSFYRKVVEGTMKGFTLKGGPFAKWRYPVNRVLYKKRLVAGPEPERPRSVWQNWNYDSEIFAFAHRLNENFKESLLRQAMIHPSYSIGQSKHKELGIDIDVTHNNLKLSIDGEKICENYLRAILGFWYPKLPQDGVSAIVNYLIETENLANIARNLGIKDLVQTQEFPVKNETLRSVLMAVIAALEQSSGPIRAHLFINDFILAPSLIGKDINEIWQVKNPMGLLCEELKKSGAKSLPVPRQIWSTGANHPTGVFIVGLYVDEQMISKGSGENLDIAEEMAARDALRRLYGTEEDQAPLPYGDRARKFSQNILPLYDSLMKKNS